MILYIQSYSCEIHCTCCSTMVLHLSLLFLLAATPITTTNAEGKTSYRASVVDYQVLQDTTLTPQQNLMNNVRNYEQFIKIAEQEAADIIVFPEEGLLGTDKTIFLIVPDPAQKIVPNASYDESLQMLSGYAKNYSLYLAVNLHENYTDSSSNKSYKYISNIVFDRNGAIIARYRKHNTHGEVGIDTQKDPEYSYFKTDFNVTFGQFSCFDILFKEPALTLISKYGVTDFIHPSHWYSEMPFLTSVQTQWGWSVGNDVTLLTAGVADPATGNGGSGIYRGKKALNNLFSFTDNLGSTILVGDVNIRGKSTDGTGKPEYTKTFYTGPGRLPLMQQPRINEFENANITLPENQTTVDFNRQICHGKLCCEFDLSVQYANESSSVQYKAVVFDGKRAFSSTEDKEFGLQICGVVLCSNGSMDSCGAPAVNGVLPHYNTSLPKIIFTRINITGNFISEDANPLPSILLWPSNLMLPTVPGSFLINANDVDFTNTTKQTSLVVNNNHQIITVGIHSRVFSRDPGNGAYMSNVSMLAMIISVLPLFMKCI